MERDYSNSHMVTISPFVMAAYCSFGIMDEPIPVSNALSISPV